MNNGTEQAAPLTGEMAAQFLRDFKANPSNRVAQNAVTQVGVDDITLNRDVVTQTHHTFSIQLDDWSVTNQKRSGRCWMFAGLNLLRVGAKKKMDIRNFEFSQNYCMFWDKLERANYFLEAITATADREADDRLVSFLLGGPAQDGGQWNMFVNLIKKHGLAPKSVMPETESSSNSQRMNSILRRKLREGAKRLRDLHAAGASTEALFATKQEYLGVVYRILSIHLGTPPDRFTWQWTDSKKKFHRDGDMTPQEFAVRYVDLPLDDYVCLVNDPRPSNSFGKTYTVDYLGNVVGGDIVRYLNVDVATMKRIAQQTLEGGEPVWFGCDSGKMMRRDIGVWDRDLYDYESLYQTSFNLEKGDRLLYRETAMTHAMLFTGVDLVDGNPRRWRVENSWGEEGGEKGFYVINDSWFDEYTFEIAAPKRYLSPELRKALDAEPVVLPAWDPMGALAH